jgi:hypothetical protein
MKWDQAKQNPEAASLAAAASMFAGGFAIKVWKELEDDAVKGTANLLRAFPSKAKDIALRGWDWGRGWLARFSPGFRRRYLAEVVQEYGLFNDRGLGLINANRLDLERVYVDLRTASDVNLTRPNFNPFSRDVSKEHSLWTFLRSLRPGIALAVVGPPGSGKTTLMHHVLLTFARNRQRRHRLRARLPLLLELRTVAAAVARRRSTTLGEAVEQQVQRALPDLAEHTPAGWFERQLLAGRCLVLLDGLDEVADPAKRLAVSHWVDEQVRREAYRRNQFILTSRPQGYRSAPLERATVLEVQPFTPSQVERFIDNWYLANEVVSSGGKETAEVRRRARKEAKDLRERLVGNPSLHDLTGNPLLLTMMVMVHRYHGALPGSRVQLYAEVCQVLLERWRQAKGVREELRGDQKLTVLRPLAHHLMSQRVREVSEADALRVIARPLELLGIKADKGADFLRSLQADSGLLLEKEQGVWHFAHLSFQEYLTAAHWREAPPAAGAWPALVLDPWWRETILLYAAQNDASAIVDAALDANEPVASALAFDCEEQALTLLPQARERLKERLHESLRSADREVFVPAAAALLHRSQRQYVPLAPDREIASAFVTQAEYQLFLVQVPPGAAGRPPQWRGPWFSGEPQQPAVGVFAQDAKAYCRWLDARYGQWSHRPPTAGEAAAKPLANDALSEWTRTPDGPFISPVPPGLRGEVTNWMTGRPRSPVPVAEAELGRALDLSLGRDFAFLLALDLDLDLAQTRALVLDLDLDTTLAEELGLDLVRARDLDRALDRARNRASERARILPGDLGPARGSYIIRAHYLKIISSIGFFFALALALHRRHSEDNHPARHLDFDPTGQITDSLGKVTVKNTPFTSVLQALMRAIQSPDEPSAHRAYRLFLVEVLDLWLSAPFRYAGSLLGALARASNWFRGGDSTVQRHRAQQLLLRVVLARAEGASPAWEAIRVVRERRR